MSIKYYRLAKDEKLPEKFCAVKDVGGEPSKYVFYVPESESAKLRELVRDMMQFFENGGYCDTCEKAAECEESEIYESDCLMRRVFKDRMRELGVDA